MGTILFCVIYRTVLSSILVLLLAVLRIDLAEPNYLKRRRGFGGNMIKRKQEKLIYRQKFFSLTHLL